MKSITVPFLSILFFAGCANSKKEEKESPERPNILWIVVEDMSCDFGYQGQKLVTTPNVDRLASEGIVFRNAYVTAPVCSPSRSALITGMYQTTIGAQNHRSSRGELKIQLPDGIKTIPELFKEAGYYTCNGTEKNGQKGKEDYNFSYNSKALYDGTDWSGRAKGQPFFAQIQLRGGKLRNVPKWYDEVVAGLDPTILVKPNEVSLPPYYPDVEAFRQDWAEYLNNVSYTDKEVGDILGRLEKDNLLDNTVIFFITDHGISQARGKQFLYDEGTKIPFIVWGTKLFKPQVIDDLINHIDMSATSLQLAGIKIPEYMEAKPLLGENYTPRDYIICARDRCDETVDHIRSVRKGNFKYIKNYLPLRPYLQPNKYKDHKPWMPILKKLDEEGKLNAIQKLVTAKTRPEEELYDLSIDPFEINNLAYDAQYLAKLTEIRGILNDWIASTGDKGAVPEPEAMYDSDVKAGIGNPYDLTTELSPEPLGIDAKNPRFSWKMSPTKNTNEYVKRGLIQTAYRILVAMEPNKLKENKADIWDSGKISSSQSVLVGGIPNVLKSKTRFYWTVRLWDENGQGGQYAKPTWFETGMLNEEDWCQEVKTQWISSGIGTEKDEFVEYWQKSAVLGAEKQLPKNAKVTQEELDQYHESIANQLDNTKPAVYFRKEFKINFRPVKARLYITGLGYYKPFLNGERIPSPYLAPNVSHYPKRVLYNLYDVTKMVSKGENCIGAIVAAGRWDESPSPHIKEVYGENPMLFARLEIELSDGTTTVITTDSSWKAGTGAFRRAAFWVGEAYDANKEPKGWSETGFDEHSNKWSPVLVTNSPTDLLQYDYDYPQNQTSLTKAICRTEVSPGVWVYDFGRMVIGKAKIKFNLPKDKAVRIRYSESVNITLEGTNIRAMYFANYKKPVEQSHPQFILPKSRGGSQIRGKGPGMVPGIFYLFGYADAFKSAGEPMEWIGSFDYTGFRYIEISTLDDAPEIEDVAAVSIHSDIPKTGNLDVSDTLLNNIQNACYNSFLMNVHSQTEDNPGAERAGGLGMTATINFLHSAYHGETSRLMRKMIDDIRIINEDFDFPATVTFTTRQAKSKESNHMVTVADGYCFGSLALDFYKQYGDENLLRSFVPTMKRYFDYLFFKDFVWKDQPRFADHIDMSSVNDLDHINGRPTDELFVHACQVAIQCRGFLETLKFLGEEDMLAKYTREYEKLLGQIRERYYDNTSNRFLISAPSRQGANIFAMDAGIVPESDYQELVDEIVDDIRNNTNGHQATGSRSSERLLYYLSNYGYANEALRLMKRTEYPSIGYMLPYTYWTVWEDWGEGPSKVTKASFAQAEGISAMANWFYRDIVGITPEKEAPAFKRFILKPNVPSKLGKVFFSYNSPYGEIKSEWKEEKGKVLWKVKVPPNSTAELNFPVAKESIIMENGVRIGEAEGIKFLRNKNDRQIYEVASGEYIFNF